MFQGQLSPMVPVLVAALSQSLFGLDLVVNSSADPTEASKVTLRDAFAAIVGSTETSHTITFDSSLNGSTITLDSGALEVLREDFPETPGGDPVIPVTDPISVTIDASELPEGLTIDANLTSRIFRFSDVDVMMEGLKLRNGRLMAFAEGGAGILASGGSLEMEFCELTNCRAELGDGGGLFALETSGSIRNCLIQGNSAFGNGGGLLLNVVGSFELSSTEFSGNAAVNGNGGGISNQGSVIELTNCTLQGNKNRGVSSEGGSATAVFENCIFDGNSGTTGTTADRQVRTATGSSSTFTASLVEGANMASSFSSGTGWGSVTWLSGNLDGTTDSPVFLSPVVAASAPQLGADLRLENGSPGIDQGSNLLSVDSLDAGSRPRIKNTTVDMGAFEGNFTSFAICYPSLSETGDENQNGFTNLQEYGLGLDPTTPGPVDPADLPTLSSSGGATILTIRQRDNAIDLNTIWETSSDLDVWDEMVEGVDFSITDTTSLTTERVEFELTLLSPGPWRFYKQGFQSNP